MNWSQSLRFAFLIWGAGALVLPTAASEFEAETISVRTLTPGDPYRLYIPDPALNHVVDGRVLVVDGEKMKIVGMVGASMAALTTLSPDRSEIYIATTYHARLNRGERSDQLEVYDALTLKLKAEISIPPKRVHSLPYPDLIHTTSDGSYVLIQNATPATSVSIVGAGERKFLAEVPTPGCWSIYPAASAARRFSTLCGDGTLLTISFDETGKVVSQRRSEKFFDPDGDPVFASSGGIGDERVFISFKGVVHVANVGGEVATVGEPWPLVAEAADRKAAWRPGGYQLFAVHVDSRRLFVGMHPHGQEGSHKTPAQEVWVFDLDKRRRLARLPGSNALAVAVTQGTAPKLFVLDAQSSALVNISMSGKPRVGPRFDGIVEVPFAIQVQ